MTTETANRRNGGAKSSDGGTEDRNHRGHFAPGNRSGEATRFTSGNDAARTTGVRAFEARGAAALPADLRTSVEEFRNQVVADRGGVDGLTAIEAGYIRRLSELETVSRLLVADLASRGLFTPKHRVRSTFSRWLEALDRWDRFAMRVGVDRKARAVNFQERLAQALAQRTDEDQP